MLNTGIKGSASEIVTNEKTAVAACVAADAERRECRLLLPQRRQPQRIPRSPTGAGTRTGARTRH